VPLFFARADGARLVDVDGNEYIDYVCGYGPVVLGHGHPDVAEAVFGAATRLQQIGGQHEAEIELAEALCQAVPAMERVRTSISGSEAVHAALRLARGATGRTIIVKFIGHYHGWLDSVLSDSAYDGCAKPATLGQLHSALADVVLLEWNDAAGLQRAFAELGPSIAAVIMEPLPCNGGVIPPRPGFLELARDLTRNSGAVLIFDEVITGFRVGVGGAQEMLGVVPDLAVVAKAMANGFPISAFGGRADLMEFIADKRVLHAGTYNGGGVSVAAALATIRTLESEPIHKHLTRLGTRLRDGLVEVAARHSRRLVAQGPGPVFFTWFLDDGEVTSYSEHLGADHETYGAFAELLLEHGVRVIPAGRWYLNAAHTDADIDRTLEAAEASLAQLNGRSRSPSSTTRSTARH
jgi:glutamate-1-semialdehyde 2,1-aminomutase